jgi:hypothetical protein
MTGADRCQCGHTRDEHSGRGPRAATTVIPAASYRRLELERVSCLACKCVEFRLERLRTLRGAR